MEVMVAVPLLNGKRLRWEGMIPVHVGAGKNTNTVAGDEKERNQGLHPNRLPLKHRNYTGSEFKV
jgi:hypothetical protein